MNALEIRNLTKAYPGFRLDNLNLTLPSGCIWVWSEKTAPEKALPSS